MEGEEGPGMMEFSRVEQLLKEQAKKNNLSRQRRQEQERVMAALSVENEELDKEIATYQRILSERKNVEKRKFEACADLFSRADRVNKECNSNAQQLSEGFFLLNCYREKIAETSYATLKSREELVNKLQARDELEDKLLGLREYVKKLAEELSSVQASNDTLQKENELIKEENKSKEKELTEEAVLEEAERQAVEKAETENAQLVDRKIEMEEDGEDLRKKIADALAGIESLTSKHDYIQDRVKNEKARELALKEEWGKLCASAETKTIAINSLTRECDEQLAKYKEAMATLKAKSEEKKMLEDKKQCMVQKICDMCEDIKRLRKMKNDLYEEKQSVDTDERKLLNEITRMQDRVGRTEKKEIDVKAKLQVIQNSVAELQASVDAATEELTNLQAQLGLSETATANARAKLLKRLKEKQELQQEFKTVEMKLQDANAKFEEISQRKTAIGNEKETLCKQLQELVQKIEELAVEKQELCLEESALEDLKMQTGEIETEATNLSSAKDKLFRRKSELEQQVETLNEEKRCKASQAAKNIEDLENQRILFNQKISAVNDQISKVEQQILEQTKESNILKEELLKLTHSVVNVQGNLTDLASSEQSENKLFEERKASLEASIQERQAELAELNKSLEVSKCKKTELTNEVDLLRNTISQAMMHRDTVVSTTVELETYIGKKELKLEELKMTFKKLEIQGFQFDEEDVAVKSLKNTLASIDADLKAASARKQQTSTELDNFREKIERNENQKKTLIDENTSLRKSIKAAEIKLRKIPVSDPSETVKKLEVEKSKLQELKNKHQETQKLITEMKAYICSAKEETAKLLKEQEEVKKRSVIKENELNCLRKEIEHFSRTLSEDSKKKEEAIQSEKELTKTVRNLQKELEQAEKDEEARALEVTSSQKKLKELEEAKISVEKQIEDVLRHQNLPPTVSQESASSSRTQLTRDEVKERGNICEKPKAIDASSPKSVIPATTSEDSGSSSRESSESEWEPEPVQPSRSTKPSKGSGASSKANPRGSGGRGRQRK